MLRVSQIMKRTNDSVLQEVQPQTRLLCLIQSEMLSYFGTLQEEMETIWRNSSYKDELEGA